MGASFEELRFEVEGQGTEVAPLIALDNAVNERVIDTVDAERAGVLAAVRRLLAT